MSESNSQRNICKQQMSHLAYAHCQALKFLVEDSQPNKLSVKNALSFFGLAKLKLGEAKTNEFLKLLEQSKDENCDIITILYEISNIFQGHPDLIQGFGMFLPPSLNVLFQTGGIRLHRGDPPVTDLNENCEMEKDSLKSEEENLNGVLMSEEENSHDTISKSCVKIEKRDENISKEMTDAYAVTFLGKVKERFQDEPIIFERFLDLLNSIRKENTGSRIELETEVFAEVSELFQGYEELLEEFKTFVPNVTSKQNLSDTQESNENPISDSEDPNYEQVCTEVNDPSVAPVYKFGSYEEHLFFDKVRSAVGHRKVFDNFLRCLMLYNEDVVSRSEVLKLATSFLGKFPDLLKQFKDMLGFSESGYNIETIPIEIVKLENQRNDPEVALDIDYATGGRTGASYRALPRDFNQPKCSGRTPLCNEVLNDTWVSFPSWSEDSTFVTSCKTQYEEIIYRCEDERFELDMALAANRYTMELVESLQKKINKMTPEEKSTFYLDDYLGGNSCVIHQKALHRLYGDKTEELVEGLKRNPVVAVPIILKRLKVKEEEWKEKQTYFNTIWRDQIDKYYLKSLDHQGINFKQNDSKGFRSKSLLNELDMVYAEQKANQTMNSSAHYVLEFKDMSIFQDAINLMLQYLKKLPGVYRDDRRRIEMLIRSFIPDIFCAPRANIPAMALDEEGTERKKNGMNEEEGESKENEDPMDTGSNFDENSPPSPSVRDEGSSELDDSNSNEENESDVSNGTFVEDSDVFDKIDPLPSTNMPYTVFFTSKTWFIFFRQFHILCERLSRLLFESTRQDLPVKPEDAKLKKLPSYKEIIDKLSLLLSGTIDYSQFEEMARSLFGIHAYISFTMDKLVLNIVRQLQQVVTDDVSKQITAYFVQHTKSVAASSYSSPLEVGHLENDYRRKAEKVIEEEKCFKVLWHKKELVMTIQLIEHEIEEIYPDPCEAEKWSNYLDTYVNEDTIAEELLYVNEGSPVFLKRNLRRQTEFWKNKVSLVEKMWNARHSTNFIKRNIAMFKKRKAIALANSALRAMRLAAEESQPEEDTAMEEDQPEAAEDNPEQQQEDDLQKPKETDPLPTESAEDPKDVEAEEEPDKTELEEKKEGESTEVEEKLDVVLVDLSSEGMSLQEESVQDSEPIKEEKEEDLSEENVADAPEAMEVDPPEDVAEVTLPAAECDVKPEGENKEEMIGKEEKEAEKVAEDPKPCTEEEPVEKAEDKEVGPENVEETQATEVDRPAEKVQEEETEEATVEKVADSEQEEKMDGDQTSPAESPEKDGPKVAHRSSDLSPKAKKSRIYQNYVKRRLKRSMGRMGGGAPKGKRRRVSKALSEDFQDVFFDHANYSELNEEEKICYLASRNVDVDDNTQVTFSQRSYKMTFVRNSYTYFVRRGALARSREIHQSISEIKSSNFNSWHRIWLERYVTSSMSKCCNDWLLRSDPERFKVVLITVSNCTKPPYIPYNKYKVRYYKNAPVTV